VRVRSRRLASYRHRRETDWSPTLAADRDDMVLRLRWTPAPLTAELWLHSSTIYASLCITLRACFSLQLSSTVCNGQADLIWIADHEEKVDII